jgi:hypothetical protein
MRYEQLLEIVGSARVFESSLLLAGDVAPADIASQLSRWVRSGKVLQLRRGLYALPKSVRPVPLDEAAVPGMLVRPSYVSLQSALSRYGMIPEAVFWTTSITTARTARYRTPLGDYLFRHVAPKWFFGFTARESRFGPDVLVATPEKALLDLAYVTKDSDNPAYVRELRLENLDQLDLGRMFKIAEDARKPRLVRFTEQVRLLAEEEAAEEWEEIA